MMAAMYRNALRLLLVIIGFSVLLAAAGAPPVAVGGSNSEQTNCFPRRLCLAALPNAYRLHEKVISGGLPAGEAGFQALMQLGVRTIISVDAARPPLALAQRFGIRYVHLPHGYDGIPAERIRELAKAVQQLPGPIYIHCHHGKHRSPAAAAVACIAAGYLTREQGCQVLASAGTSPDYRGLYRAVANAARQHGLEELDVEFRQTEEVPPLAIAMVQIERTHDNLLRLERAGWRVLESHPDQTPAHEALLLREHFTELARSGGVRARPIVFRQLLQTALRRTALLEQQLRSVPATPTQEQQQRLSAVLAAIGNDCTRCHRHHRD